MATKVMVSLADYLATSYEHDREYVHGEVVERGMPNRDHSEIQTEIWLLAKNAGLFAYVELRHRLHGDLYRIPDVAIFSERPSQVPSDPPLVVVEVVSPGDGHSELKAKLREYQEFGVPHIWVVDPQDQTLSTFQAGRLTEVTQLSLDGRLQINRHDLFPKAD